MKLFFKINFYLLYGIYYIYNNFIYTKDLKAIHDNDIARRHSIFIISLLHSSLIDAFLNNFLAFKLKYNPPVIASFSFCILIWIFFAKKYNKKEFEENITNTIGDKNKWYFYSIFSIIYIIVVAILFLKLGERTKDYLTPPLVLVCNEEL